MTKTYKCDDPAHWEPVTSTIVRCVHCRKPVRRKASAYHLCKPRKTYEQIMAKRAEEAEARARREARRG